MIIVAIDHNDFERSRSESFGDGGSAKPSSNYDDDAGHLMPEVQLGIGSWRMKPSVGSNLFFRGALYKNSCRAGITCIPLHPDARRAEIDVFGVTLVFESRSQQPSR